MLRHYIKTSIRGIKFHPFYSIVSIFGLSVGLASCLLIFSFWSYEKSYDKFHSHLDQIYRVSELKKLENEVISASASTYSRVGEKLRNDFAGAEAVLRIHPLAQNTSIQFEETIFQQDGILGVETGFFDFFDFEFIAGSASNWKNTPQSVILTESLALKLFRKTDPVGKPIIINGAYGAYGADGYEEFKNYTVAGIIQDIPINTHLEFSALISLDLYSNPDREFSNWGNSLYTYVKLPKNGNQADLDEALGQIATETFPDSGLQFYSLGLEDIHLKSSLLNEFKSNGSEQALYLLAALAVLILVIAGCNYVNFATARAIQRHKEIGLRKIFWARKYQLFEQLFTEAIFVNLIATVLAFLLIALVNPFLFSLTNIDLLHEMIFNLGIGYQLAIIAAAVLFSGLYPAWLVSKSSYQSLSSNSQSQLKIQRPIVVFQFAISIFVIGFTLLISAQLRFMQESNAGLELEKTLVLNGPSVENSEFDLGQRLESFQSSLKTDSRIKGVSAANFIPGKLISGNAEGYVRRLSVPEEEANNYSFTQIDEDFIPEFKLEILAGRGFNNASSGQETVIINEEASKLLGFESPEDAIGQRIHYRRNSTPEIIGVIKNFHQFSLREAYQPIIFEKGKQPDSYLYLKFNSSSETALLSDLKASWEQAFPGNPFNYFYLDEFYNQQYQQDQNFFQVFQIFSGLAILVASLGFFWLTFFLATTKVKEIGIRKTLGAEFKDVVAILGKGTVPSLLIAGLISIPFIYFLGNSWLQDYAFRIAIGWWVLLLPLILFGLLTLFIIQIQALRSYRANPIDALQEGGNGNLSR